MSWHEHLAVGIFTRHREGDTAVGAGAFVTPSLVLTARGVATRQGPLLVKTRDGHERAATLHPWAVEGLDVALLQVDPVAVRVPHPLLLLADRAVEAETVWEADGHLVHITDALRDAWKKVGGRARSCPRGASRWELDVTTELDREVGLPGGAVVVRCQVVGVVGERPGVSRGTCYEATPVGCFLGDRRFREALGVRDGDDVFARRIDLVEAAVRERLGASAALHDALRRQLATTGDVASELVRRRAVSDVAGALDAADLELLRDGDLPARRELRALMLGVLPYAADRHELVREGAEALRRKDSTFDLPLSTETAAELVFAGVDDRLGSFVLGEALPCGVALVRVPGVAEEYLHPPDGNDPDGGRAAVLTLMEVARRLRVDPGIIARPERCFAAVEGKLRSLLRTAAAGGEPPLYVLLDDAESRGRGSTSLWAVMTSSLGGRVPSLRFVRLTGSDDPADEYTAGSHLGEVLGRKV